MEKVSFDGEMDRITTANTIEDKDMVRVDSCGQMEKLMTGIMWMINEPEKEYTAGQTVRFTKVHFSKVKDTATVLSPQVMASATKENG